MANQEYLDILKQGVEVWNQWRQEHPEILPNLSGADLNGVDLGNADLSRSDITLAHVNGANLSGALLVGSNLYNADLRGANLQNSLIGQGNLRKTNLSNATLIGATLENADLREADLSETFHFRINLLDADLRGATLNNADLREAKLCTADLRKANLSGADLSGANLNEARLNRANLRGAILRMANLTWTILSEADLCGADLTGCSVYAISAWNVHLEDANQSNLIITDVNEPIITVDNLKLAQFIYLLLTNKDVREVIDTITSKVVLILGRFTPARKKVLDAIRNELHKHNYSPVVFDFEKPVNRDITETISILAHLARFVIADITQAKSIPQELERIVPNLPSVPVQPLLQARAKEYGMFEHFTKYPWVLPIYRYRSIDDTLKTIHEKIIHPAEEKAKALGHQ